MAWLKARQNTSMSPSSSKEEAGRRLDEWAERHYRMATIEPEQTERAKLREKRIRQWAEQARAKGQKPRREMFSQLPIGELPAPAKKPKKADEPRQTWTRTCPRTGLVQVRYLPPLPEQTEEERLFWEREEAMEVGDAEFHKRMGIGVRYELMDPVEPVYRGFTASGQRQRVGFKPRARKPGPKAGL
jgi:hypothetical protein